MTIEKSFARISQIMHFLKKYTLFTHAFFFISAPIILLLVIFFSSCKSPKEAVHQMSLGLREEKIVTASWYGEPFHGKQTASGEIYDMYAMTCAHRELPFGTKLKIEHMENGKTVHVVVNDRGPYVAGREIDLSYGAAKKIGLIGSGVGQVRLSYLGREEGYKKDIMDAKDTYRGPYTVQIGSFKNQYNAERVMIALRHKYKNVYIKTVLLYGVEYFRVRIGRFFKKSEAYQMAEVLSHEGYTVLITRTE